MFIAVSCISLVCYSIYLIGHGLKTEFDVNQDQ
jgi:hypothetical protein